MSTSFATASDGARIAYERSGTGSPLLLLHGGFVQDRHCWRTEGYLTLLKTEFTVVAMDLRGHGESTRPSGAEAYASGRMVDDVYAVLDAEGIVGALVWGYSLGASVALQLAVRRSERVKAVVLGGAALGPWLTEEAAKKMTTMIATAAEAKERGRIDALPPAYRTFAARADLRVAFDVYTAIPSWPVVEPEALRCPALFYLGSDNAVSASSLRAYESRLRAVGALQIILDGLDHEGEFHAVERVVPRCREFLIGDR